MMLFLKPYCFKNSMGMQCINVVIIYQIHHYTDSFKYKKAGMS